MTLPETFLEQRALLIPASIAFRQTHDGARHAHGLRQLGRRRFQDALDLLCTPRLLQSGCPGDKSCRSPRGADFADSIARNRGRRACAW